MAVIVTIAYSLFTPMRPNLGDNWLNTAISYYFLFVLAFFSLEAVLQLSALGCRYFRQPWSYVDLSATALLSLGCVGIFLGEWLDCEFLQVCRFGVTLYLPQFVAKLPVMRVTAAAILKALPEFVEVMVISVFLIMTFAIILVAEYKGKLGSCDLDTVLHNTSAMAVLESDFGLTNGVIYFDFVRRGAARANSPCNGTVTPTTITTATTATASTITTDVDVVGSVSYSVVSASGPEDAAAFLPVEQQRRWSRRDCLESGGTWLNPLPNFDNLGNAYMALFHLSTTEGWVELMQRCVNAVGKDQHPMVGYDYSRMAAFVLFVLVVGIALMQLAATVVVTNFKLLAQRESGLLSLTRTQREFLSSANAIATIDLRRRARPPPAKSQWCRRGVFRVAEHRAFTSVTSAMVVFYLLACLVEATAPTDVAVRTGCFIAEAVAGLYFVVEIAIKLVAFGRWFVLRWDQDVEGLLSGGDGVGGGAGGAGGGGGGDDGGSDGGGWCCGRGRSRVRPFDGRRRASSVGRFDDSSEFPDDLERKMESGSITAKERKQRQQQQRRRHKRPRRGLGQRQQHQHQQEEEEDEDEDEEEQQQRGGCGGGGCGCSRRVGHAPRQHLHGNNILDIVSTVFCVASVVLSFLVLHEPEDALRETSTSSTSSSSTSNTTTGESYEEDGSGTQWLRTAALVFRALRLIRIASLLRRAPTIRRYLNTLGHSALAVGNIFVLYFVLMNMFALIFREFFHFVQLSPESRDGLDPRAHFQSWLQAFSVMVRSTTGEAWHKIAYDLMTDRDNCTDLRSVTAQSTAEFQSHLSFTDGERLASKQDFGVRTTTTACYS
jgi:hypothetical protein